MHGHPCCVCSLVQEAGLTEEQVYAVADAIRSSEMPVRIAFIKAAAARRFTADYYHLKVRLEWKGGGEGDKGTWGDGAKTRWAGLQMI